MAAPPRDAGETLAQLERGPLRPVYVLGGGDRYLGDRALATLRRRALEGGLADFNADLFVGGDLKAGGGGAAARILTAARTAPMMAPRRLVLVREVDALPADELEPLVAYLEDPCPTTVLILVAAKLDERTRFAQAAKRSGALLKLDPPGPRELPRLVQAEARARELGLEPDAAARLAELVGTDLARLASALDQLALYVEPGRAARVDDVEELVAETRERTAWELADALVAGQVERALRVLRSMLDRKDSPLQLLGAVIYRYRQLWVAAAVARRGGAAADVARAARVPPFVASRLLDEARRFREPELARAWDALWRADRALKGANVGDELVLERLVLELSGARRSGAGAA